MGKTCRERGRTSKEAVATRPALPARPGGGAGMGLFRALVQEVGASSLWATVNCTGRPGTMVEMACL